MAVTTPQPQQYCLRWNNHQHNLLSVFEDLLNHEAFVDVTIACDGLNLKAHKMVLSACSPYFQSMLKTASKCSPHPVIVMPQDVQVMSDLPRLHLTNTGDISVRGAHQSHRLHVLRGGGHTRE